MHIETDDLSRPQVHALLQEHLDNMYELSPPDHVFALDLSKFRVPEISFWTVWEEDQLLGCGALKELTPLEGEIKSMRTTYLARRRGAGRKVLQHIISVAQSRRYSTLRLETGSHSAFAPAHGLYHSHGFTVAGAFGSYAPDPHSVFLQLNLQYSPTTRDCEPRPRIKTERTG